MEMATSIPDHSISIPSSVMPILPAEPDCNPPNLWDDPSIHAANGEAVWWCLHTKPRQEKATARELGALGAVYYLPQVLKETRTPKGRKIQSVVPLFTSYMFLKGDVNDRLLALRGHRLVSVIEVIDQEALARDLHQVYTVLRSGLPVTSEDAVPVGATVRIMTGPLTGMVGKVVRRAKRDQFVAVVRFLGRGAMVDLQDWQVEQVAD
jgi:transcription antitermination factor NusG